MQLQPIDEVVELGFATIALRRGVAWRMFDFAGQRRCYLTLQDDELDRRVDELCARVSDLGAGDDAALIGYCLEPADTLLTAAAHRVTLWRGGACAIPVYWRDAAGRLQLSTRIPPPSQCVVSRSGLLAAFAVIGSVLQNDPNLVLRTPASGLTRARRGAATSWQPSVDGLAMSETPIDFADAPLPERLLERAGIIEALRDGITRFGAARSHAANTAVELSGGMDSTLAAWSVRQHGARLLGISIAFPFYEFRYEDAMQLEAAQRLGVERLEVDGRSVYAFTPQDPRLPLDEPMIISMIAKRETTFAELARAAGADTILVGEGGDQLLSEHLLEPMRIEDHIDRRAIRPHSRAALDATVQAMRAAPTVYLKRSTMCYSYDARLMLAVKERWGVTTRTPFTDLDLVLCGIAYAKWCAARAFNPGKQIVAEAFADVLPAAILHRRGKVTWEGVYARTYIASAPHIAAEFEACHQALEEVGFDVSWLMRRVAALASLETTDYGRADREIMATYAVAAWLNERGIARRADCAWTA
jgi:hypothetical protein